MVTSVGNNCLFMMSSHVAHDAKVGNHVVFANNATLGGHVEIEDYVILGGLSAVHQFCRVGRHAMIGGMSGVEQDVIPYGSVMGNRARLAGLNVVGLKRRGFSRGDITALRKAYRLLFAEEGTMAERLADVSEMYKENEAVMDIVEFIRSDSARGDLSANGGACRLSWESSPAAATCRFTSSQPAAKPAGTFSSLHSRTTPRLPNCRSPRTPGSGWATPVPG